MYSEQSWKSALKLKVFRGFGGFIPNQYYYYDLFVEHMNYKIGSDIRLEIRYDYKSIYT